MNEEERKVQKKKATTVQYILAASTSTLLLSADFSRDALSPNGFFAFIEFAIAWVVCAGLAGAFIDGVETFVDSFCFSYYGERSKFNTIVLAAICCFITYLVGSRLL